MGYHTQTHNFYRTQGRWGHRTVNYSGTQSSFIRYTENFGEFYEILIGWYKRIIFIYRWNNLVNHNWGCTRTYYPLSYPSGSLSTNRKEVS